MEKIINSGKPLKTCKQCNEEYDNYQLSSSQYCSGTCKSRWEKENKKKPDLPAPGAEIIPFTASPALPLVSTNKAQADGQVPMYLYNEKIAEINQLRLKVDAYQREEKNAAKEIAALEKQLAVKEASKEVPATLGGVPADVVTTLLANPESIKAIFEGFGSVMGKGKQMGGTGDNAVLQLLAAASPEIQQQAAVVFQYLLTFPEQLTASYNVIVAAKNTTS